MSLIEFGLTQLLLRALLLLCDTMADQQQNNDNSSMRVAEEWVEGVEGGSTLSGNGGLTSRNASTSDLRKPFSQQTKLKRLERGGSMLNIHDASDTQSYGAPISVQTSGNFPAIGSTLGPYFCVGRLGSGTFASIHKCINLDYFHRRAANTENNQTFSNNPRLTAAKVEIEDFRNSGVLSGEASILHFLHSVLPKHTVPVYMGHYRALQSSNEVEDDDVSKQAKQQKQKAQNKNDVASAIVMEYLVRRSA